MIGKRKGIRHLEARVAVVTGAASGIGRALAWALRDRGCHLALVDIDEDGLARVQAELRSGCDLRVTAHVANVGDRERMRTLAPEVADAHGAIHLLINSAGIAYEAPFPQTTLDAWDRILKANLWGVVYGCHFFLPYLARVERGHIVNLCSLLGVVAMPGQTAYCTTKFAVRGFSEALHEELRTTSVGLTLAYPGAVATNIMKRAKGDDPELLKRLSDWYQRHAMPPERAAARIIRAVERGAPRVLISPESHLGDVVRRLMPIAGNRFMVDAIIRRLGVGDMRARRARQWRETMLDGEADPAHRTDAR